eukprot:TRINITY_DN17154_c0_g1_i1.p1 TRINITY_DN17154_c0_g1~~TRINITY_DN17154_c0_g1_i1.p1  ORF type:complete len:503 (-),score=91.83 TRINITY_DN17154_c0_g1_i1:161-1669(-)
MAPKKAAEGSKPPLKGIHTWVRIRPIGGGGHTDGEAVEKQLGAFDEKSVRIVHHDQGKKETSHDYMSGVFPTDCTQVDVADNVLPDLLEDFWSDKNAMIFAYGQTGTGKTHTMFGMADSLTKTEENPGWGLLPRAVHATLKKIEERRASGINSVLLLSAMEFYCMCGYDLADKASKQMCTMRGSQVLGNSYQHCDSPAVLAEFLERVYGNRNVVATKMNAGSSRSHCAITLTLMTSDTNEDTLRQTSFSIVDLAGAERPEKASHTGKRITKDEAIMELWTAGQAMKKGVTPQLSLELQGYLINFELTGLLTEVVTATDQAKHNRPYRTGQGIVGGSAVAFLQSALAGEARLSALVCLSQSPQNGWETWFSICQYGEKLAKLKTRVNSVPILKSAKALEEARKALAAAELEVQNQRDTPSAMKYAALRLGMKVYTTQRLHFMELVCGMSKAAAGAAGEAKAATSCTATADIPPPAAEQQKPAAQAAAGATTTKLEDPGAAAKP